MENKELKNSALNTVDEDLTRNVSDTEKKENMEKKNENTRETTNVVDDNAKNETLKEENKSSVDQMNEKEEKKESAADAILRRIAASKTKEKTSDEKKEENQEVKKEETITNETLVKEVEKTEEKKVEKEDPVNEEVKPVIKTETKTVTETETKAEEEKQAQEQQKEKEEVKTPEAISDNKEAVEAETENETAQVNEKQDDSEDEKRLLIDYSNHTKEELVAAGKELLVSEDITKIKRDIENIRTNYFKKRNTEIAELKKAFIENGGVAMDFKHEPDQLDEDIKQLYASYRDKRTELAEKIEQEKEENLKAKYQIIDEIKDLINNQESINKTFQDFRELQRRWREIGLVPQQEVKTLWETYHLHVENFYNYIKINKELRDLDLKKNLEKKMNLCEKAEELLLEQNIVSAFRTLQKYHNQWRETGPVPVEKKDELWERFREATTQINKAHQEYFEKIKEEQENNLKAKTLLCEKAEEIADCEIDTPKNWEAKSKELIELQKVWKLIGFAPKKDNNAIYERFRSACDKFFDRKRDFFAAHKEKQMNNLQLKTDLCNQAESLKESTDWKKTTEVYINLQKQWKTIGPVPRKHSDAIWNRFRAACNFFFDKKSEHFSQIDSQQEKNLELKEKLIEEIKSFAFSNDNDFNLNQLKDFQKRWTEIGFVPIAKKDEIQRNYRTVINSRFDEMRETQAKNSATTFKNKIEVLQNSPKPQAKLKQEREKVANKLKEVQNDIVLLENNIGFFAKSKNTESLITDVKNKIDKARKQANQLKEQLRMIDKADKRDDQNENM